MHPSPGCMPPYHPGRKFNYDDDIAIVFKATSKIINFVLQDMGAGNLLVSFTGGRFCTLFLVFPYIGGFFNIPLNQVQDFLDKDSNANYKFTC